MSTKNLNNGEKIKSGFQIPDGYFEQFDSKLLIKLPKKETKVLSLWNTSKIWISSAAATIIVGLLVVFLIQTNASATIQNPIETTTLENYLSTELSTYEISDKLTNEDINALEKSLSLNQTVNKDDIEEYLLDSQNLDYYLNY